MKIDLGMPVRDTITGFEGLAIAHATYLTGCEQYLVQPRKLHEGQPAKPRWFDESELDVLGPVEARTTAVAQLPIQQPGGPQEHAPQTH